MRWWGLHVSIASIVEVIAYWRPKTVIVGSNPTRGKLFLFFCAYFLTFFLKKSQKNILKMNFRQWGTVWSVAIWRIPNFQIFWMKNRLLSQCDLLGHHVKESKKCIFGVKIQKSWYIFWLFLAFLNCPSKIVQVLITIKIVH